jgi:hypothetical protein
MQSELSALFVAPSDTRRLEFSEGSCTSSQVEGGRKPSFSPDAKRNEACEGSVSSAAFNYQFMLDALAGWSDREPVTMEVSIPYGSCMACLRSDPQRIIQLTAVVMGVSCG